MTSPAQRFRAALVSGPPALTAADRLEADKIGAKLGEGPITDEQWARIVARPRLELDYPTLLQSNRAAGAAMRRCRFFAS